MPGPIRLLEYGDAQGAACLYVNAAELDLTQDDCLVRYVLAHRQPGVAFVQLVGKIPWSCVELDRAIIMLATDARTEGVDLWAKRSVYEERWSSVPIWWCHDVSKLMDKPRTADQVIQLIQELPFLPGAAEIVAINPNPKVISATVLDEIHTRLDAGAGWLYVDKEHVDLATREIAKSATHWGVRVYATPK